MAPPNVIIFGERGGGKSSIINLLADASVAETSSNLDGGTLKSNAYNVSIDGTMFKFHDTQGLGDTEQQAIVQLQELLCSLSDGVSLLIFCMRGQSIKASCIRNWQLVWDNICQRRVPILLAITGLENEEQMDAWWERNQISFTKNLMYPNSVTCITATKGKKMRDGSHAFDYEYAESRGKIMKAVQTIYRREAWKVERV
ncbi:hypothetical protein JOM56_013867 [Amanita muscaria]